MVVFKDLANVKLVDPQEEVIDRRDFFTLDFNRYCVSFGELIDPEMYRLDRECSIGKCDM